MGEGIMIVEEVENDIEVVLGAANIAAEGTNDTMLKEAIVEQISAHRTPKTARSGAN
jgi:hypothetical protein